MSDNVIPFSIVKSMDVPASDVLSGAIEDLDGGNVIVFGKDRYGVYYLASSYADSGKALLMLERCKLAIIDCEDEDE